MEQAEVYGDVAHVEVAVKVGCCLDRLVAEDQLQRLQAAAAAQEPCRECVARQVRVR